MPRKTTPKKKRPYKRTGEVEQKGSKGAAVTGTAVNLDLALYRRAYEVYREHQSANAVYDAIPEIGRVVAKKLVEQGVPELGLPSLRRKLNAALALAVQQDIDEAAQSVSVGRAAIRTAIRSLLVRVNAIATDPKEIAGLNALGAMNVLVRLVELNEALSAPPKDLADDALEQIAETANSVLGGLLKSIAARRLPKSPDPEKINATTPDQLEKLLKSGKLE